MNIFLVRHGQSAANVDHSVYKDVADHAIQLSDSGEQQAVRAGEAFYKFLDGFWDPSSYDHNGRPPLIRFWTSPYERARRTAKIIHSCNLYFSEGVIRDNVCLAEQQFGLFDGIPEEDLPAIFPLEYDHYKKCERHGGKFWARMPLGESQMDVAIRVQQMFGTLHRDAEKGIRTVVIVAHGVTLRAFTMQWLHRPVEWFENEPNPNNCSIRLIRDNKDCGYIYEGE